MTAIDPLADITTIKRHPIRGLLWGILMGFGLTVVLIVTKVIDLQLSTMVIVTAASIVLGVVWGLTAPAKPVKGLPPAHLRRAPAPLLTSRFDDFGSGPAHQAPLTVAEPPGTLDEPRAAADPGTTGND